MTKIFSFILLAGMTMMLLGCGLSTSNPIDEPGPLVEEPAPPPSTGRPQPSAVLQLPLYAGDSLIEEKIIESLVIVKATMTSFLSEVITEADGRYSVALEFNLDVSEHLKGTGPSSIVAVWVDGSSYDTNDEATDAKVIILAERDGQWDDREAIIFLYGVGSGLGASLDTKLQLADHFLLYVGDPYSPDDFYSLHSKRHKAWLPAASSTGSTGDNQEFLLDVPPPGSTSTAPTITLGDLKTRITEVAAEFRGGDGSQAYRDCVVEKYRYIRNQLNWPEERGEAYTLWNINQSFVSGRPRGTVLDQREAYGGYPDTKVALWLEGRDSALFDTSDGDSTASDTDSDGEYDTIKYEQRVIFGRPLPAGEYRFDLKEPWRYHIICNFVISNEWTITVNAPAGTLHEAFFDPVTVGTAVSADDSNGVLKPASFADANGASAILERIAWEPGTGESGTVKLQVNPPTGLTDQEVNFIALDGSVSLSLQVANATVDAANRTLSWAVSLQPWQSGDKLMLRIREDG